MYHLFCVLVPCMFIDENVLLLMCDTDVRGMLD